MALKMVELKVASKVDLSVYQACRMAEMKEGKTVASTVEMLVVRRVLNRVAMRVV